MSALQQRFTALAVSLDINEKSIIRKAEELNRILDTRGQSSLKGLNLIGESKMVICLDCAASQLGLSFNKKLAYERSGISKKAYQNACRFIETVLDIKRTTSINDLVILLGVPQLLTLTSNLIKRYLDTVLHGDTTLVSPAVNVAAISVAAKQEKVNLKTTKLLELAGCTKAVLERIKSQMEKIASSLSSECSPEPSVETLSGDKRSSNDAIHGPVRTSPRKRKADIGQLSSPPTQSIKKKLSDKVQHVTSTDMNLPTDEDSFEVWKQKILSRARARLQA